LRSFKFTKAKWSQDLEGTWVSFLLPDKQKSLDIISMIKEGIMYVAEIKQYREKRSLDANAYFHVLVHKIADAMNLGEDETKVNLVLEYGSVMRDENGDKVGFKLPSSVDVNSIYKYAKRFDKRIENGKEFNCYIVYEHTHNYDTKQMARLIDGTVYEAQELGIETMTPKEIEKLKELWGKEI
jgi:hypothetical protein